MLSLNLRNFMYLDTQLLEDYLSAIKGELYEEETIIEKEEHTGGGSVGAKIAGLGGEGKKEKTTGREVRKRVKKTDSSLFQELYGILQSKQAFSYYELITPDIWENTRRNSLLEVNVSARFSVLDGLTDLVEQIGSLASLVETTTGQKMIDDKAAEAIKGLRGLGQIHSNKGIPCVFNFKSSPDYKLISYLNPEYFKVEKEQMIGELTLFCKVQRLLEEDEEFELVDLFSSLKHLRLSREQRRKLDFPGDLSMPPELTDTVTGPAAIVIPVAIYR